MGKDYSWVPFYMEFADKLLVYKSNRQGLIEKIREVYQGMGERLPTIESDNNNIPDIDPFTVFALFNRGRMSAHSRRKCLTHFKEVFNLNADVPTGFDGVPVHNFTQYCFYHYVGDTRRKEKVFEILWDLFECALNYAHTSEDTAAQDFAALYRKALDLPLIERAKMTMGLFHIRPSTFVNLDSKNKEMIISQFGVGVWQKLVAPDTYLQAIEDLKSQMKDNPEFQTEYPFVVLSSKELPHSHEGGTEQHGNNNGSSNSIVNGTKGNDHELNLILYGPPGTGKTYNTVIKAVSIIDGNNPQADSKVVSALQALENDPADHAAYEIVLKRYRELKKKGRIAFTTFHQAYGYEEFIEGIKPIAQNGSVIYEVKDGVFKEFCDKAREIKQKQTNSNSAPEEFKIRPNATVWKVSLDNVGWRHCPLHDKCLDEGCIRIGWDKFEDPALVHDPKNCVGQFIDEMQIGDIVLSCYSWSAIDAIGVITGDYEWHDSEQELKRFRKVEWLKRWNDENVLNIKDINHNKNFSQPAVHKVQISVDDIISILNEKSDSQGKEIGEIEYDYGTPYVFIIDEINRGNVAKIFGELITLIERTKRLGAKEEMTCVLPYSSDKPPFGVPKNVYILGTMNTADRSLVQLDAALRRRFAFEEMMPRPDLLGTIDGIDLKDLLTAINKRITALLDREHQIGHSYFMDVKDTKGLVYVFKQKIIPLLQEYFFDDYTMITKVLGAKFVVHEDISIGGETKTVYGIPSENKFPQDAASYRAIYSDSSAHEAGEEDN